MGVPLVEAAASSSISGSTPAEFSAKPAAPETPSLQLGTVPSEMSQQNRRMPEGAFGAFMATTDALSAARFCSGDSTLTMLVDSGVTHNFVDPLLTPRLQDMVSDYRVLDVPHTIVAAGQHDRQGVATGTVQGTVIDDGGCETNFSFKAVVEPRIGANLFSVIEATWKGVSTIFHPDKPRMEFDEIVLPMNLLGTDEKTAVLHQGGDWRWPWWTCYAS